jgi:hypothetical protein
MVDHPCYHATTVSVTTTFIIMTLSITTFIIMTFSIMTLIIMTFSIMTLSIMMIDTAKQKAECRGATLGQWFPNPLANSL